MPEPTLYDDLTLALDWLEGGRRRRREAPAAPPENASGAVPTAADELTAAAKPRPRRDPADDTLEAVALEIGRCAKCRLSATRKRVVPGEGQVRPLVMVIGEGPGAEEDEQGLPFVGAAGKLLDRMLAAVDLSRRTNAFIANIVKCRPPLNRDPAPDEQAACLPFLRRQIALVQPRYLLAAGRIAAQALLGTRDGITRLRGRFYEFEGIPLLPTFHPSAILHDESLKRPAWEDLKLLRERMTRDGCPPARPNAP